MFKIYFLRIFKHEVGWLELGYGTTIDKTCKQTLDFSIIYEVCFKSSSLPQWKSLKQFHEELS